MTRESKKFRTAINGTSIRILGLAGVGAAAKITSAIPGVRGHIPEPFDIANHLGNVNVSTAAGALGGLLLGSLLSATRAGESNSENGLKRRTQAAMAAGGLAVGAAINAATETKYGISLMPEFTGWQDSTPGTTDFVYGTVVAGVSGLVGYGYEIQPIEPEAHSNSEQIVPAGPSVS